MLKVGVNVEIVSYEWGEYLKKLMEEGCKGVVILGWIGDNGDLDNFLIVFLFCVVVKEGGVNCVFWCNEEFLELLVKVKIILDQVECIKFYEQVQVIFKDQVLWVMFVYLM